MCDVFSQKCGCQVNYNRILILMETVTFRDGDYSHKFTKNISWNQRLTIAHLSPSVLLFLLSFSLFIPLTVLSITVLKMKKTPLLFWLLIQRKKNKLDLSSCGDNEIKTARPFFSTPHSRVFFFSFSDWHLLIWGSWLPITCFQSHFTSAAGLTRGMSFRRVDEEQGGREGW